MARMPSSSTVLLLRDIALPPLIIAGLYLGALVLHQVWVALFFLAIAFGHFVLPVMYQARGGRITRRYLLVVVLLGGALIAGYVAFPTSDLIVRIAILISALHVAIDEFYLHNERMTFRSGITIALFTLLYIFLSFTDASWRTYALLGLGTALIFLIRGVFLKELPTRTEWYLVFIGALAVLLSTHIFLLLCFTSLVHFGNWYIAYALKLRDHPARLARYGRDVLLVTVLGVLLFALTVWQPTSILKYFFNPYYYAGWFILHMTISSRFVSGQKAPMHT